MHLFNNIILAHAVNVTAIIIILASSLFYHVLRKSMYN